MVEELRKILDKAERLPDDQQKALAQLIENELQWDNTLANSQDKLSQLAGEALQEHKSGKTKKGSW